MHFLLLLQLLGLPVQCKIQAPASVLWDDLAEETECATALLQSSMQGHRPNSKDEDVQVVWKALRSASVLSELQVQRARAALAKQEEETQNLHNVLQDQVKGFHLCDSELRGSLAAAATLNGTSAKWQGARSGCRLQEEKLRAELASCQGDACKDGQRRLHAKSAQCSSYDRAWRSTRCLSQKHMSGACKVYESCRHSMSEAFLGALHAVPSAHAAVALRCFLEGASASACDAAANELLMEPALQPCDLPQESQDCQELPSVLQAELTEELVSGVSLVQEGIEKASVLPMQHAFAGPLATPVCMLVALFTLLMLIVRCAVTFRGAKGKETVVRKVDQWCVNSERPEGWLCGELIVPKKSHCTVFLPSRGGVATDKMGQAMFCTSMVERDSELQISLSYQDGRVLANCHVQNKKAEIFQGEHSFATIVWEDGLRPWFSKPMPSCFVLRDAASKLLLRLEAAPELRVLDEIRCVATCKRGADMRLEVHGQADLGLVTLATLAVESMAD